MSVGPTGLVSDHRHRIASLLNHKQPLLIGTAVYPLVDLNTCYRPMDVVAPVLGKRLPKPTQTRLKADSLR